MRKPDPKRDIKGKGRAKGRLDRGEDYDSENGESDTEPVTSAAKSDRVASTSKIRELEDEEDEKAFAEQSTESEEEKQLVELRSTLWSNVAACELKLVSFQKHFFNRLLKFSVQSLYKEAVESASNGMSGS